MDTEMLNLLTVAEVAERLNCSRELIYQRIEQGKLAAIKIGPRGLRVSPDDLADYLAGQSERPRWNQTIRAASIETRDA